MNTLELLHTRRSVKAAEMIAPGPDASQLQAILHAAHRVPDHGKIGPWRFVIFEGAARASFGQKLAAIYANNNPEAGEKLLDFHANTLMRAPLVIAVIATPDINNAKVPVWEQHLAVGACCQNLLVAAHAVGFVGNWLTEWYSYSEDVNQLLGLRAEDAIAGFIYLGSAAAKPEERPRPALEDRISHWPWEM